MLHPDYQLIPGSSARAGDAAHDGLAVLPLTDV